MTKTPQEWQIAVWSDLINITESGHCSEEEQQLVAYACEWQLEQVARTEKAAQDAIDKALVIGLDRTLDSYESPEAAMNALCAWHESVGAYFQREKDAALEPEIPDDIKGRVQAEWFWKGVLAMKAAIKQQEKAND